MQEININLGGVTRVPDDVTSKNGDLAVAVNLASDGDGLKMLEKPVAVFSLRSGEVVLCVHQNDGYKHYVTKYDGKLWWRDNVSPYTPVEIGTSAATQAVVMGNTVITQGTTMEYWLWDQENDEYKALGQRPPEVDIQFGLVSDFAVYPGRITNSERIADPIELWDWRYTENVPIPFVSSSTQTHADRSRMDYDGSGLTSGVRPNDLLDAINTYASSHTSDVAANEFNNLWNGSADPNTMSVYGIEVTDWPDGTPGVRNIFPEIWDYSIKDSQGKSNDSKSAISDFIDYMTDSVMSRLNKFVAEEVNEKNKFLFPFFIRYCYEMYDGSQIMLSDPVLLIPSTHSPQFVICDNGTTNYNSTTGVISGSETLNFALKRFDSDGSHEKVAMLIRGRICAIISELYHSVALPGNYDDYSAWYDLINSIGIYITPPVYTYDQDGKVYGWREVKPDNESVIEDWKKIITDSYFPNVTGNYYTQFATVFNAYTEADSQPKSFAFGERSGTGDHSNGEVVTCISEWGYGPWGHFVMRMPERTNDEIRKAIIESGQYYKVAEIKYKDLVEAAHNSQAIGPSAGGPYLVQQKLTISKDVISTLTNRRQLVEEYMTGSVLSANAQYVYNRRLHIADVTHEFRAPLDPWVQITDVHFTGKLTNEAVFLKGGRILRKDGLYGLNNEPRPRWLFYPYKGVEEIWLRSVNYAGLSTHKFLGFEDHTVLNGSYWLDGRLWDSSGEMASMNYVNDNDALPTASNTSEHFEGEVWTSNVENPFVFQAGNVNQVGDGVIKALRAAVAPLAEDQHGYAPMYVFTSQGVWAMTFSKDGTPAAIDHVCGDIITEGTEPLSLSQSCLVMTERGLLALTGRNVKDLSERIDGTFAATEMESYEGQGGVLSLVGVNLLPYIGSLSVPLRGQACKMSYDYKHQRVYVWITSDRVSRGCGWVLNLRTGLWTQTEGMCAHAINAYPSCEFVEDWHDTGLTVDTTKRVMSLDGDEKYDTALLTTRPIKLTEAQAKLREVAVRGFFDPDAHGNDADVWTILHGSRDWHNYGLVATNKGDRVTRLGGSAYRSHVVSVILRDQGCTIDRIVLTVDQEQGNRLR